MILATVLYTQINLKNVAVGWGLRLGYKNAPHEQHNKQIQEASKNIAIRLVDSCTSLDIKRDHSSTITVFIFIHLSSYV